MEDFDHILSKYQVVILSLLYKYLWMFVFCFYFFSLFIFSSLFLLFKRCIIFCSAELVYNLLVLFSKFTQLNSWEHSYTCNNKKQIKGTWYLFQESFFFFFFFFFLQMFGWNAQELNHKSIEITITYSWRRHIYRKKH